ncbi:hypothetical protein YASMINEVIRUS_564 [Yasminevirus sp. GU-2018]|uniref:Protein-tyrosine-phosphatase n=1 Tax=Yasminevirus sp. GU-2018 TaxID=2420051 RepID=A0A5K0U975_9VIRU|nr:hypothetical protein YASMINEVIRUS_564 [Yasminevirus sp. GU-2018]
MAETTTPPQNFLQKARESLRRVPEPVIRKYESGTPNDKHVIHKILPNLFLTSAIGACDKETMIKFGVTHVLIPALIDNKNIKIRYPESFEYKCVEIKDLCQEDISKHLPEVIRWMDEILKDESNKILVHCFQGVSRSASFVIGYLMRLEKLSYEDALVRVRAIRKVVEPNEGFAKQLTEFEKTCL